MNTIIIFFTLLFAGIIGGILTLNDIKKFNESNMLPDRYLFVDLAFLSYGLLGSASLLGNNTVYLLVFITVTYFAYKIIQIDIKFLKINNKKNTLFKYILIGIDLLALILPSLSVMELYGKLFVK